jgi:hypothetical protein
VPCTSTNVRAGPAAASGVIAGAARPATAPFSRSRRPTTDQLRPNFSRSVVPNVRPSAGVTWNARLRTPTGGVKKLLKSEKR